MEKCLILIDGSNFYFKLKGLELHNLLTFNFPGFGKFLASGEKIVGINYYVGKIRTDGTAQTEKLFAGQQKLIAVLKRQKVHYIFGYLLKSGCVYHEKGVDVNIAVDIVVSAFEKSCDRIILVSSDTDLIPAIKKAREKGLAVHYVGFSHRPSVALVATCNQSRLLTREDLIRFIEVEN